jgi:predicted DNA-binding protein
MPPLNSKNGKRIGKPPIYGKSMTKWKFYLSDEHRALLTLASARSGRSRAALVREGIERVTAEIISTPHVRNAALEDRASGKQVDVGDSLHTV